MTNTPIDLPVAEFIREVNPEAHGDQRLWYIDRSDHGGGHYIVTSAVPCPSDTMRPETIAFAAGANGVVKSYHDLFVVYEVNHQACIEGYLRGLA